MVAWMKSWGAGGDTVGMDEELGGGSTAVSTASGL